MSTYKHSESALRETLYMQLRTTKPIMAVSNTNILLLCTLVLLLYDHSI